MPSRIRHRTQKLLRKTTLCSVYQGTGECAYGAKCHFAHSQDEIRDKPDLIGTELCSRFIYNGRCSEGSRCKFAHDETKVRRALWESEGGDDRQQTTTLESESATTSDGTRTEDRSRSSSSSKSSSSFWGGVQSWSSWEEEEDQMQFDRLALQNAEEWASWREEDKAELGRNSSMSIEEAELDLLVYIRPPSNLNVAFLGRSRSLPNLCSSAFLD
eukprot:TRINITY_DN14216_c1_g1_i3.p1 TRINITY_DN14216_c1_g1~~TRINITY_DN14216_c1_g1_i3.p1  ORF type:complete len:215 (-),score=23.92 TRINITY_DN14216_c1_g1_i3:269-913(-)